MARELHHRKKDDKYALYSTVIEDYITPWDTRDNIKQFWINDEIENAISKINMFMKEIDREV